MKRIFCALLSAGMLFTFTSCTSSSKQATNSNSDDTSQKSETVSTAETIKDGNYDMSFSNRDCDSSYSADSEKVTFKNNTASSTRSSVKMNNADITITEEGTYILTGECSNGSITVEAGDEDKIQLVMDNLSLTSSQSPLIIKNADKVFITLAEGTANTLNDSSSYNVTVDDSTVDATIFSKADLSINGKGKLTVNGNYKHAVVSKDDLVISDATLEIKAQNCGIDGKDCVKIQNSEITVDAGSDAIRSTNEEETDTRGFVYVKSGNLKLTSNNDAIQACSMIRTDGGSFNLTTGGGSSNGTAHSDFGGRMEMYSSESADTESAKAIKSAGSIKINGGNFTINSSDDAVHSNYDITVADGTFNISTGDDGFHANNVLAIDGGTINITESYEGIEAGDITVNGGTLRVVSSDDGFNAAGGSDGNVEQDAFNSDSSKKLVFNGGYTFVEASGDGLDSNGTLEITGGTVLVSGPENSGNGSLDYNTSATITGGVLVALGSGGMAQSITGSGQCTIMTDISSQSENTQFALCDSDGNVVVSLKPTKMYSNVVISTPSIKTGETYQIICGGEISGADSNGFAQSGTVNNGNSVTEITMTDENYSSGGGFGGMGGRNGGGMMKQDRRF